MKSGLQKQPSSQALMLLSSMRSTFGVVMGISLVLMGCLHLSLGLYGFISQATTAPGPTNERTALKQSNQAQKSKDSVASTIVQGVEDLVGLALIGVIIFSSLESLERRRLNWMIRRRDHQPSSDETSI